MWRCLFFLLMFGGQVCALNTFSPDATFGIGGKVTHSLGARSSARKILLQSDGKLLVFVLAQTSQNSVSILRLNADGSLDTSFGTNGQVNTTFHSEFLEAWHGGELLSDGKILIGGNTGAAGSEDFAMARYNSNGSLDTSFGQNGIATLDFSSSSESINDLTVQTDGKIIAVGKTNSLDPEQNFAAARFNSDGTPDTTFADGGKFIFDQNAPEIANSIIIQPDGKILIGGRVGAFGGVVRLNIDGTPDGNFGNGGLAAQRLIVDGTDLALQNDGKIITVGNGGMVRFNSDGSLDTGFGNSGKAELTDSHLAAIRVRPDGLIVVAGDSSFLPATDVNFVTALFDESGNLITRIDTDFDGGHERAQAVSLLSNGAVLVGGFVANDGIQLKVGLAKYTGLSRLTNEIADFDGDGKTDISVYRNGIWYFLNSSNGNFIGISFGLETDLIAPADFDGDAKTDFTIYRNGVWFQLLSSDFSVRQISFGLRGDIPVPADFDGDGKDDLAVFRQGVWYVLRSSDNLVSIELFGISTDKPVRGDFDADGKADFAVYRDGVWYQLKSSEGFSAIQFGIAGDKLVPADYDGDGRTDFAVYRDGIWYLLQSMDGFAAAQFGVSTDIPLTGDFDGDGKSDIAVYRNGTWFLLQSSSAVNIVQFGLKMDIPIPSN